MARTAQLRHASATTVFVSLTKPHKAVVARSVARWIKMLMARAGVDTSVFNQHSTRGASASWYVRNRAMSATQICKLGQWSNLTTTYKKFYHRIVLQTKR